jgi:3',5'-cyclic AMP phosphodiesterase CpdA
VTATIFTLAHLSDPHLPIPLALPRPLRRLAGKRLLAYLSWRRKRHAVHSSHVLEELLSDLAAHAPDHMAITGDLTNLALPEEFIAARDWLARLGAPGRVTVVPGNHDATVPVPWPRGQGLWEPWMRGDEVRPDGHRFPFLRRCGPVALLGLSSAVATPPFSAAGRLGRGQVARLRQALDDLGGQDLFRVVLVHHPPVAGEGGRRKALRDRAALCDALREAGAELVLHGHHHVSRLVSLPGPLGPIPVIGLPPALSCIAAPEVARWHLHRITREAPASGGWSLSTEARAYDPATAAFRTAGRWTLRLGGLNSGAV